ncbi:hypothetical protein GPA10_19985 [Streptomyces sp. p1417]|uniref:SWIM-type domain-containing protein n=1 Tax=Streptomyces typhae TaxID=2681492 RepID=A0A6L6WZL1_9ACTN|nr:hypothetical protein [Streptomyces typhae]
MNAAGRGAGGGRGADGGVGGGRGGGRRPGAAAGRRDARGSVGGGRARVFPAFAARTDPGAPFASTWWGDAWIAALEESALDPARLARGRAYARAGHVDTITVEPGRIVAYVHGSRPRPYRAELRMRTLTPEDWDRFLDAAAADPGHLVSLLARDMPHALAATADRAGARLLPGRGDLISSCTCPDRGHPCKHAAALTYQTARILDADPFALLLLRGGEERHLLDELSHRNARAATEETPAGQGRQGGQGGPGGPGSSTAEPPPLPGVLAREALASDHRPPLPPPLPPPARPGEAPLLPSAPGAPDLAALEFLAADTAARAHAHLTRGAPPFADPDPWKDAIRLAASHPGLSGRHTFGRRFAELARSVGRTPTDLSRAAAAWRQSDEEGLAVLETAWDPPAGPFDRARGALATAGLPRMTIDRNRLTDPTGTRQLRYGRDGHWYPYRGEPAADGTDWWPEGPPDTDPVGAFTVLLAT